MKTVEIAVSIIRFISITSVVQGHISNLLILFIINRDKSVRK